MVYIDARTRPRPCRNCRQMSDESLVSISIARTIRQPRAAACTCSLLNLYGSGPSPAVWKSASYPALTCPHLLEHTHKAQPCRRCLNPTNVDARTTSVNALSTFVAFGRDRTRPSTSCHKRPPQYPVTGGKISLENNDIVRHSATSDTLLIPFPSTTSPPVAHATGRVARYRRGNPHAAAISPHFGTPAAAQPVGSRPCRGI